MDGRHVFLPGRLSGIAGGLDSHRAFSGPKFPPTNFSFRQLSANNPSFPVLSATNSDVPDYTANNFSGQGFHATNFFGPNFSANSFSGSESPAFAGVWDGGIFEHRSNLPQNSDGGLDSCAFPIGQTNDLGLLGLGIGQEGLYPPQNIGAWDGGIYEHGSNVPQNSYGGLDSCAFPISQTDDLGLPGSGIGRDGLYPSHNFDNTLEALIHVSPSLRISPKEAIGVQIENNRSESVEVLQIDEVMPMNSLAQKPIGENKGKRTGRTKIEIALEDMLKYDTVKEAALNLNVSESTVDRRIKDHTKGPWSIAKRKAFPRKPVSKKGRVQDKNRVLVKVAYEGTKRSFEMPWASKLGELHSLVESSLKLEAGTYDIQYFDGAEDISIACDANLHCCFANAPRSPRSNSILLNLTDSSSLRN